MSTLLVLVATGSSSAGATTSSHERPATATQVIQALTKAGLPATISVTYTAATDPNHLLGRPGGYVSKAAFTDSRIPPSTDPSLLGDISLGGGVEYFGSSTSATTRANYLKSLAQSAPELVNEYDYVDGKVLLRISGTLTPSEAAQYDKAFVAIMKPAKPKPKHKGT